MMIQKADIVKEGQMNGLYAGLICVVVSLLCYVIDVNIFLGFAPLLIGYATILSFKIITAIRIKNRQGNYISFGDAFKSMVIVSVVSLLIFAAFGYVMYNFIDPDLPTLLKEKTVERTVSFMEWANAPDDEIEKAIERVKKGDYAPTLLSSLKGYLGQVVVGGIFALLFAAIFYFITKNNAPEVLVEEEIQ